MEPLSKGAALMTGDEFMLWVLLVAFIASVVIMVKDFWGSD